MNPAGIDFRRPTRIEEALALLREAATAGMAKAGGTDVMLLLKHDAARPRVMVGLSEVAELKGIRRVGNSILLGAGTTIAALELDPLLAEGAPGLVDAARRMATVQIRTIATVGGNLASAAACGDLAPVLIALEATIRLRSLDGERALSLVDFFTGPRTTVLAPGELITRLEIPVAGPRTASAYAKFGYRGGSQIAVVSAAAGVTQEAGVARRVRLVMGAVAPVPFLVKGASVLVGRPVEGAALEAACAAAASECRPISDIRGSEAYRRAIASVVARQALESAWRRSLGHDS
ncbi:MAG: FAD binding domain-containing protein [Hyphomicrobiales bacterium]